MKKIGNLSGFTKIIPYIIVAVLIAAAYYIFMYNPMIEAEQELSEEISSLREEIRVLEQELGDVENLQAEIDYREDEMRDLLELDIYDKQKAMDILENKIQETDLRLRNSVLKDTEDGYLYTLSLAGNYRSFYDFLSMIDEGDFRYRIEDFIINTYDDELHMLININFYQWDILQQFYENESGR